MAEAERCLMVSALPVCVCVCMCSSKRVVINLSIGVISGCRENARDLRPISLCLPIFEVFIMRV